jgi:hypothetical protein
MLPVEFRLFASGSSRESDMLEYPVFGGLPSPEVPPWRMKSPTWVRLKSSSAALRLRWRMKKNNPMAIPATATTPTTTPAAIPATFVLEPPSDLLPVAPSGDWVCCSLDGIVTTTVVPGAMLVETAPPVGAFVVEGAAVVLGAAALDELELAVSST